MNSIPGHDTPAPTSQKPLLCFLLGSSFLPDFQQHRAVLPVDIYGATPRIPFIMKDRRLFFFKERPLFTHLFPLVQITPPRCRRSSSRTGSGSWAASRKPSVPFTTRGRGPTTLPLTFLGFGVLWSSNWRTTPPVLPGTLASSSKP